jgi:hypothetical protein
VHDDEKLNRFLPHNLIDSHTQRRPWFREEEHVFQKTAAQAAKIIRAGGRVGVGSHGQLQGLGYHWEMWSLASGGLAPMETLRAATLHGAEIIGLAQDLGSIEPGKLADLVVLDANPLEDIHNMNTVRYVVKNGRSSREAPSIESGFTEEASAALVVDELAELSRGPRLTGATPKGTEAFRSEALKRGPPSTFREVEGLRSSIGIGTYLGESDEATDDLYAGRWSSRHSRARTSSTPPSTIAARGASGRSGSHSRIWKRGASRANR